MIGIGISLQNHVAQARGRFEGILGPGPVGHGQCAASSIRWHLVDTTLCLQVSRGHLQPMVSATPAQTRSKCFTSRTVYAGACCCSCVLKVPALRDPVCNKQTRTHVNRILAPRIQRTTGRGKKRYPFGLRWESQAGN